MFHHAETMFKQLVLLLVSATCSGSISVDPNDGGYRDVVFAFEKDVPPDESLITNLKVRSLSLKYDMYIQLNTLIFHIRQYC